MTRKLRSSRGSTAPSNSISPASIVSNPLVHRSSVDFPDPDGPIRHTTSPACTSSDTPSSALSSPYRLTTPRYRMTRGRSAFARCITRLSSVIQTPHSDVGELGNGDYGDERRILEQGHPRADQYRKDATQCLRNNYPTQGLRAAH